MIDGAMTQGGELREGALPGSTANSPQPTREGSQSTIGTHHTAKSNTPTNTEGSQTTMETDLSDTTTVAGKDLPDSDMKEATIQAYGANGITGSALTPVVSSDGKYILLVTEDQRGIQILDADKGEIVCGMSGHKDLVTAIAVMCNDMAFLTASLDKTVKVWSFQDNTLNEKDEILFEQPVLHLAAHPKNKVIAVCLKGNSVRMRHLEQKDVDEVKIELQDSYVTSLILNDDRLIYGTDIGKVYMWNYEISDPNDDPVSMLTGHVQQVKFLGLSHDRLLSCAVEDCDISVWNLKTGKLKCRLTTECDNYTAVTLASKERLAFLATSDLRLLVYTTRGRQLVSVEGLRGVATCLHVHADHLVVVYANGEVFKLEMSAWIKSAEAMDQSVNQTDKDTDRTGHGNGQIVGDQTNSATCNIL